MYLLTTVADRSFLPSLLVATATLTARVVLETRRVFARALPSV